MASDGGKAILDLPDDAEGGAAAGGVKGALASITGAVTSVSKWFNTNPHARKVKNASVMVYDGTWKATKKVGEYAWVVGATAVVVVVPLMLEMEREATFQLQAELMQKQMMDIQRGAPAAPPS
uniref:Mitochondrial import receptor subunit TOM22 homolog n=1 Tax=Bicosoecida sp. CB-2014 TaxID=1486930 RepID=A0A7S1G8W9_9STRA|mmetsp:Transcript_23350/g.81373  ORF Transcript_23350/g.81373 Transcript_23350/m.81373 type:complete len:123 (+) Transcript_23350:330-698(+)